MASTVRWEKRRAALGGPILVESLIGGDGVPKVLHARIGGGCVWQWLVVEAGLAGEQSNQGVGGLNVFKGHA